MSTGELRDNFLIENLMSDDELKLVYSHYDRVIVGGAKPVKKTLSLETHNELKADYFLERRELGIINIGGEGTVEASGESFSISKLDAAYIGKGVKEVRFTSSDKDSPALFYLLEGNEITIKP